MTARVLVLASAFIVALLGSIHLLYTFRGRRLLPRDASVQAAMDSTGLVLTTQTTVWRAWLGFNASHSIGMMLFGLVYGYLAGVHPDWLFGSVFLQVLGLLVLAAVTVLARLYWFIIPLTGVSVALACYAVGLLVVIAQAPGAH